MEWTPETILKLSGQVATAAVTGIVAWRKLRLRVLLWRNSIELVTKLKHHFGDDPSTRIKELLDDIIRAADAMEVRQNIVCDHLGIGIYMCSLEAKCTYANPQLADIFGIGREEMLGWGWLQAIARGDQTRVREAWQLAVRERLPYRETYTLRDGTEVETEAFLIASHSSYVGYVTIRGKSQALVGD